MILFSAYKMLNDSDLRFSSTNVVQSNVTTNVVVVRHKKRRFLRLEKSVKRYSSHCVYEERENGHTYKEKEKKNTLLNEPS